MILAGKMLKAARLDAGLTQAELAERLGASQPVVARLESGRANPRVATFERALVAGNLRLAPGERIGKFASAYRGVSSLGSAALKRGGP